ncbi:hypothetical protein Glove_151g89 [Diversispora epigaea]|uniref:Protein kinase domain-containing protein n=1 Tax=Diversispora epigaea TaxID=1348612 RepID=A0A397IT07_9GLOM|nr:hypothetical protein Glove_151g89 [Diversispora epigaea]
MESKPVTINTIIMKALQKETEEDYTKFGMGRKIVWNDKLLSVWDRTYLALDFNIHKSVSYQEKHRKNMIRKNPSLTKNEKKFLLDELQKSYDKFKISNHSRKNLKCNNCEKLHRATQYCEFCIQNYLKNNFRNWTSGNSKIDKLIQNCQRNTASPEFVIEWINYDQFENIKYLTEGGCATIYTATWKVGRYHKWNPEKQILERSRDQKVVLKRLNNSDSNNIHWFQEVTFSFTLDKASNKLAVCRGLTKDPITHDYMLVLKYYNTDLRQFLKNNYRSLTLLKKYMIIDKITRSLFKMHEKRIMHRDLHSGNILYNASNLRWYISDLGLSGPVNKPSNSIYGNLPFVAPEVYCGQSYTEKSDIYSIGILMWEVITGKIPHGDHDYENNSHLALAIASGYRPKIYKYIPLEYANLMKQCWDADPDNRPNTKILKKNMRSLVKSLYEEMDQEQPKSSFTENKDKQVIKNNKSNKNKGNESKGSEINKVQTSKLYTFNFPIKPRNATDEEQRAYETKQFDFEISEEMEQLYTKSIETDNCNKSCADEECEIAGHAHNFKIKENFFSIICILLFLYFLFFVIYF